VVSSEVVVAASPHEADPPTTGCEGRGRDEDCSPPPAQIPAGAANAPGSSLGFWRRSDAEAEGAIS
jgi:hypothetical protein